MYSVSLSNNNSTFDSITVDSLQLAISFARNRGSRYTVHIVKTDPDGILSNDGSLVSFSYDSGSDSFAVYDAFDGTWTPVPDNKLESFIVDYIG